MAFFLKLKSYLFCNNKKIGPGVLDNNVEIKGNQSLLIHANSEAEARVLESKLRAYGIPVFEDYDYSGLCSRVIVGNTIFGVKIYVPSELLDEAKDIISEQQI